MPKLSSRFLSSLSGLTFILTFALACDEAEAERREFTVASYNVENLFDQIDEDRNASYGDYRLTANDQGKNSNYGEPVEFDGRLMSFTDVKILGIRKVLLAIAPQGPDIVGLQEIESETALSQLHDQVRDLGYSVSLFSGWTEGKPTAVSVALLSKFPLTSHQLLEVAPARQTENPRTILKATLDVEGHPFIVYVNHWKSKSGPEEERIAYAEAIQKDLETNHLNIDVFTDYVIMGDLNSNYNEIVTTPEKTGINTVLKAQGDEQKMLSASPLKYNLLYELEPEKRKTEYSGPRFGWGSFDHIIVGPGLYQTGGISYVDNSFRVAAPDMAALAFLFNDDGTTKRWNAHFRDGFTTHKVGGYSDHLPVFARFAVTSGSTSEILSLTNPGRPDDGDPQP